MNTKKKLRPRNAKNPDGTWNRKIAQARGDGLWVPRVFDRMSKDGTALTRLVKCGCCDESVRIDFYADKDAEVNGVLASLEDWEEILKPPQDFDRRAFAARARILKSKKSSVSKPTARKATRKR